MSKSDGGPTPRSPRWPARRIRARVAELSRLVLRCGACVTLFVAGACDDDAPDEMNSEASTTLGTDSAGSSGDDGPVGGTSTAESGDSAATSTGEGPSSSTSSGGAEESTGEDLEPDGRVPAFVAQGHMGRTMISCDDGLTWIADRSLDDTVRCFEPLDCDHHEGSATGLTYADGVFVASWGWGTEGEIQVSEDGVEWTTVLVGPTFAGTAWGNDTLLAAAKFPYRAGPLGERWTELADSGLDAWTPRGIAFAPLAGGLFVLAGGGGGEGDVVVSASNGDTWEPAVGAESCGGDVAKISAGGGAIVIATNEASEVQACVSQDLGASFSPAQLPEPVRGLSWTGDSFVGFGASARYTSADGVSWEGTPYATKQPQLTAIGRSPEGTYVAQRDGWIVWYEDQALYRSEDGLSWTALPAGSFNPSHPIRRITAGRVRPHALGCSGER